MKPPPWIETASCEELLAESDHVAHPRESRSIVLRYSPPRVVSIEKKEIIGEPVFADISTSLVQRSNLTIRMQGRRLTRLTNTFCKKLENLKAAMDLHFVHYNFVRHRTLDDARAERIVIASLEKGEHMSTTTGTTATTTSSSTGHFADAHELLEFARSFMAERINALRKDVAHCLVEPYAPFPAFLLGFSTVDLLGALAAGDATSRGGGGTTKKAKDYMTRFMQYTDEQATMLQRMFRHKLVHLAEPQSVITDANGRRIAWKYVHDVVPEHLTIQPLGPNPHFVSVTATWRVPCDHVFTVGIQQFVAGIEDSVQRLPDGYLNQLAVDANLLALFEHAVGQIYDPNQK